MPMVTIFYEASGDYVMYLQAPDWENVWINVREGQVAIEGEHPEDSYLHEGQVILMPPRPAGAAPWIFDRMFGAWADPRTAADMQLLLSQAREATSLDKSELLARLLIGQVLSPEDIAVAGEGHIPPALEPALQMLPPEAQLIARIKWRNDAVISRMNPVIALAGAALGLSEALLDDLFGVPLPS